MVVAKGINERGHKQREPAAVASIRATRVPTCLQVVHRYRGAAYREQQWMRNSSENKRKVFAMSGGQGREEMKGLGEKAKCWSGLNIFG